MLLLARKRGLLHTRDIAGLGVPTVVLTRLVRGGQLVRAGRGVYALAGQSGSAHRSLAEVALQFATEVLTPGGAFLCKVFQGGTESQLLTLLKRDFTTVRHIKPPASRTESARSEEHTSELQSR